MRINFWSLLATYIFVVVSGAPRAKRFSPWDMYAGIGAAAYAGSDGVFSGVGAYPDSPIRIPWFMGPPSYYNPFAFFPPIINMKPWYKGDNVCVHTAFAKDPPEFAAMEASTDFGGVDFSHESEHCRGTDKYYICKGRTSTNEGSQLYMTKYQCCHGFKRNPYGIGCIEDPNFVKVSTPSYAGEGLDASTVYSFVENKQVAGGVPIQ